MSSEDLKFAVELVVPRAFIREYFDGVARANAASGRSTDAMVCGDGGICVRSDVPVKDSLFEQLLNSNLVSNVVDSVMKSDKSDKQDDESEEQLNETSVPPPQASSPVQLDGAFSMARMYISGNKDKQVTLKMKAQLEQLSKLLDQQEAELGGKDEKQEKKQEKKQTKSEKKRAAPAYQESAAPVIPVTNGSDQMSEIMKMVGPMMQSLMGAVAKTEVKTEGEEKSEKSEKTEKKAE